MANELIIILATLNKMNNLGEMMKKYKDFKGEYVSKIYEGELL